MANILMNKYNNTSDSKMCFFNKMQSLRAIACIFICFNHTKFFNENTFGSIGVEIFLILSGYLTVYNAERRGELRKGYLWDKVKKILFLYWGITIILFIVGRIMPQIANSLEFTMESLFYSMLLIPGHTFLLFPGWTLTFMFMFYVIFWISDKISVKNRSVISLIFIGLLIFIGILNDLYWGIELLKDYSNPMMLEFAYGIILYYVMKHINKYVSSVENSITSIIIIMLLITFFFEYNDCFGARYLLPALAVCVIIGLSTFAYVPQKLLSRIARLGDYSYTVYIIHPLILRPLDKILLHICGGYSFIYFILVFISIALTIGGAILFQKIQNLCISYISNKKD